MSIRSATIVHVGLWGGACAVLGAMVSAALLFVFRLTSGGDNLDYLYIARSLLAGDWREAMQWRYPPGYPAFLAAIAQIAGGHLGGEFLHLDARTFRAMQIAGVFIHAATALLAYIWSLRISASVGIAITVALLVGLNQHLAVMASIIGAEPLFILLMLSSMWAMDRLFDRPKIGRAILAAGLVLATTAVRPAALAMAVAAGLVAVWLAATRRGWRSVLLWAGTGALPLTAYAIHLYAGNREYVEALSGGTAYFALEYYVSTPAPLRAMRHFIPGLASLADASAPRILFGEDSLLAIIGAPSVLAWVAVVPVIGVALLGAWAVLRRRGADPSLLTCMIYLGVISFTMSPKGRYYLPMVPVALWLLGEGYRALPPLRRRAGVGIVAVGVLASWLIAINAYAGVKNWRRQFSLAAESPWSPARYRAAGELEFAEHMDMAHILAHRSAPDAEVFASKASFLELIAQRHTRYLQSYTTPEELGVALADAARAREVYLLADVLAPGSRLAKQRDALLSGPLGDEVALLEVARGPEGSVLYRVQLRADDERGEL